MQKSLNQVQQNKNKSYKCSCGKQYLSNAALFTHVKQKHNGTAPGQLIKPLSSRRRGRPKKQTNIRPNYYFYGRDKNQNAKDHLQVNYFINFQHIKPIKKIKQNTFQKTKIESLEQTRYNLSSKKQVCKNIIESLKYIYNKLRQEQYILFQQLVDYRQFKVYLYLNSTQDKETTFYVLWSNLNQFLQQYFQQREVQQTILIFFLYFEYLYQLNKEKLIYNSLDFIAQQASRYIQQFLNYKIVQHKLQNIYIFKREKPTQILVWLCCFINLKQLQFFKQPKIQTVTLKYT